MRAGLPPFRLTVMATGNTTPARRMKQCRIWARPWGIPTLVGRPPPPPSPPRPVPRSVARVVTPVHPFGARPRRARKNDCLFLPDMEIALQILQARHAASPPRVDVMAPVRHLPGPEPLLGAPAAIGLLMLVAPPLAVTLVWTSPRFDATARMALTIFGGLVTVVMATMLVLTLG
jgi:hypothetical protein